MQELKMKAQWAEDWEARISSLADAGKLKFKDDGLLKKSNEDKNFQMLPSCSKIVLSVNSLGQP